MLMKPGQFIIFFFYINFLCFPFFLSRAPQFLSTSFTYIILILTVYGFSTRLNQILKSTPNRSISRIFIDNFQHSKLLIEGIITFLPLIFHNFFAFYHGKLYTQIKSCYFKSYKMCTC
jgi:hypothetical protein